ncbi:MAG: serine/threonine-protein kinase, partial [Planctomycetota bacterium]
MDEHEIFIKAIELQGSEQMEYLIEACRGDSALVQRIKSLLRAHSETGGLFSETGDSLSSTFAGSLSPTPGMNIGDRYRLREPIGEGGMGSVWLAEQRTPVKRNVAIKLVKPGMDSKAVLARFEAERQALALMDHPHIAKVLDGGVTDYGRPFFAMELVRGIPLAEYCDQAQQTVAERLELFLKICNAVQHAHQKGVIHRDLKPSNILVTEHDGRPVPKIIDFGLAKALHGTHALTDHSLHTPFGSVLGTPLYMAPEQLGSSAFDIDTRADLYALGVILYELLTGVTPIERERLKRAAQEEVLRMIREYEPPVPSSRLSSSDSLPAVAARRHVEPARLTRLVRGDLDWIVMKSLEKDRNRRYETASGLAMDIRRHLTGEPVLAAPPSRLYKWKKLIRRHRTAFSFATLFTLVLIGGIIGTSYGLHLASLATGRATEKQALAERQGIRAEQREKDAIDAITRFGEVVANNRELKNDPALAPLRRTLLKEPIEFLETLKQKLQADAETDAPSLLRLADTAYNLATLTDEIGEKADAESLLQECREILAGLPTEARDGTSSDRLAMTYGSLGEVLWDMGQPEDALEMFEQSLAIYRTLNNPKTTERTAETDLRCRLSNCLTKIGEIQFATSADSKRARESFESAIEELGPVDPDSQSLIEAFAKSQQGLAVVL